MRSGRRRGCIRAKERGVGKKEEKEVKGREAREIMNTMRSLQAKI